MRGARQNNYAGFLEKHVVANNFRIDFDGEQDSAKKFPGGPWAHGPDREEFKHAGLPCLLLRNKFGAWCGYVAVRAAHPYYGRDTSGEGVTDLEVHGGVTFAGHCRGEICHQPEPGEPDDVWWLGFDCAHAGDVLPGLPINTFSDAVYRDINYAREETKQLAEQLAHA